MLDLKKSLTRWTARTCHCFIFKVKWIRCKHQYHRQNWLHWLVALVELVWEKSSPQPIRDTVLPSSLVTVISSPLLQGPFASGLTCSCVWCLRSDAANSATHQGRPHMVYAPSFAPAAAFKHITTWPSFYSLENILFVHFLFDIYNSLILTSNVLNVYLSVILSYRSNKPETRQIQGA